MLQYNAAGEMTATTETEYSKALGNNCPHAGLDRSYRSR